MTLDVTDDWQYLDGTETVYYQVRRGDAHFDEGVAVAGALRGRLSRDAMQFVGGTAGLEYDDVVFQLPGPNLSGIRPSPGDRLRDADTIEYRVVATEHSTIIDRWKLVCRKLIGR